MASQFFGLNIAYTGLLASNAALNTTSNNISNVQTDGYSRQQVSQQASSPIRVFQQYGCAGAGVETLAVERVRDQFYDTKYWNNNATVGEYDMKQYYMKQIETYFDDDGSKAGFQTVFDQLMINGMEELLKTPSSVTAKTQFVGYAGALTEYFNGLAGNMEVLQKDLNLELKTKVDQLNSLASEIATLNNQINTIELTGISANELRDRRDLIIDQLSELVTVEVTETPIVDPNQPERVTGANRCLVRIAGGEILVDGSAYNGLEVHARKDYEKVNQTDVDGLYDIYWTDSGEKFNMYNTYLGGTLKGLIEMRDGNNGENFYGKISGTGMAADNVRETVTIQVTADYLKDLNKLNLTDQGGIINLNNQLFYFDSWSYEKSYDTAGQEIVEYTFTLSDSTRNDSRLPSNLKGRDATIGKDVNYQGIPYYMRQMNEWLRTFSQKFNDVLKSGYSDVGQKGTLLFTGKDDMATEQMEFKDDYRYDTFDYNTYLSTGKSMVVDVTSDSYYRLTAGNVQILKALDLDAGRLANRFQEGDGPDQGDLLKELRDMVNDKTKMNFRGASASEFLQGILSDVALNASRANSLYQNSSNISETIQNQRLSISGVDEDEEAVNLVKYQNGYNLASKMIQILTEIYDRLILETGV